MPSTGAANIFTVSASMAATTARRNWAVFASMKTRGESHFLAFACIGGERFRYEYDLTADWKLGIRLEKVLPFDPGHPVPLCTGGGRAAPPEDCCGARDYLERLDRHRYPFEDLAIMAEAVQRLIDSDGDRKAIGNLDELRESVERMKAYQEFQPERFERRQMNRQLRAMREVQP